MLAQGRSSSTKRRGLADVSSGLIFLKKKKKKKNGQRIRTNHSQKNKRKWLMNIKRCSSSLVDREMQKKVTMGYHFPPIRWTEIKEQWHLPPVGSGRVHLGAAGRDVGSHNTVQSNLALAIKMKNTYHFNLSSIPGALSHRIRAMCMDRYVLGYLLQRYS